MFESEILVSLQNSDETINGELFAKANKVREENVGEIVYLRAIIEFSNHCRRNCLYCGLRKANRKLSRYRMTEDEIFRTAKNAWQMGYQTIVMQSGEDPYFDRNRIANLIVRIKAETSL